MFRFLHLSCIRIDPPFLLDTIHFCCRIEQKKKLFRESRASESTVDVLQVCVPTRPFKYFEGCFSRKAALPPFRNLLSSIEINPKSQMWVISDNYINMGASMLESKSERLKIYSSEYLKISDLE